MRRHYELVDVTKFVMAVMVIGIHANSIVREGYPILLSFLMGTAVPFFFITSGFLLAEHTELNRNASKYVTQQYFFSYVNKIFIFYLCWTILYLPIPLPSILARVRRDGTCPVFWRATVPTCCWPTAAALSSATASMRSLPES